MLMRVALPENELQSPRPPSGIRLSQWLGWMSLAMGAMEIVGFPSRLSYFLPLLHFEWSFHSAALWFNLLVECVFAVGGILLVNGGWQILRRSMGAARSLAMGAMLLLYAHGGVVVLNIYYEFDGDSRPPREHIALILLNSFFSINLAILPVTLFWIFRHDKMREMFSGMSAGIAESTPLVPGQDQTLMVESPASAGVPLAYFGVPSGMIESNLHSETIHHCTQVVYWGVVGVAVTLLARVVITYGTLRQHFAWPWEPGVSYPFELTVQMLGESLAPLLLIGGFGGLQGRRQTRAVLIFSLGVMVAIYTASAVYHSRVWIQVVMQFPQADTFFPLCRYLLSRIAETVLMLLLPVLLLGVSLCHAFAEDFQRRCESTEARLNG